MWCYMISDTLGERKHLPHIVWGAPKILNKVALGWILMYIILYHDKLYFTGIPGLGLCLICLYSAIYCVNNILERFTIIAQNQIARVDSFTNLANRWVFRFRLNASISTHSLISFGKQSYARGPYTDNAYLPNVSCLNLGAFMALCSLDLMKYLLLFDGWSFLRCT